MLYRIGEVAELIGVSNETLRNYERAGIIHSYRTEGSNIRYYDIETISKLIGIWTRRNEGFSIEELQKVYTDITGEEYQALIGDKIGRMEQEIAMKQLVLQKMRWTQEQIRMAEERPNFCRRMLSPRLYTLQYREGDALRSPAVMKQWARYLFLIQNFVQYRAEDFLKAGIFCQVSLAAQAEEIALLEMDGVADDPAVTVREPVDCVVCTCQRRDIHSPYADCAEEIRAYFQAERLRLAGNPFCISIGGYHEKGRRHTVVNLYLPV